ncbi:MAG: chaperone modulator CbpM [Oligoflexia bacterium]|nr:chaperone modulator CbpM [Oligoflexia bacterium]
MRHPLKEAAKQCGIAPEVIVRFISFSWIVPVDPEHQVLDEEDIARARLIWELQADFGVNDEAVPIILHLIDQLNRRV